MRHSVYEMSDGDIAAQVLARARAVVGPAKSPVALHEPSFDGSELEFVRDCVQSGWVSSVGAYVERFERMLEEVTGVFYAVATVNGTAALHLCLLAAGVVRDDEVLVPTLTFVATANAIAYCGAVPHFVDSDLRTLGVDPAKLDDYLREIAQTREGACFNRYTGRRIKALIVMHTFGHPVDLDAVAAVSDRYGISLIEDAAESLGSRYAGRPTGSHGLLTSLSFNGNKVITTGGGGAVLTRDASLHARVRHWATTARVPDRFSFVHDEVGYNYRMPNINAALGCAQLAKLEAFVERKRALARRYELHFADLAGATWFREPERCRSNYWLNALLIDGADQARRNAVLSALNEGGIQSRPCWTLMHRLKMFRDCPRMTTEGADTIERSLVNLPSSASLGSL